MDYLSQSPYRCKLDWGAQGAQLAAARGDIVVLVDTLSFSTTVIKAVSRGAIIYPCGDDNDCKTFAATIGAVPSVDRKQVPSLGQFSLSPSTFDHVEQGTKIALWSPNGANCSKVASTAPFVFLGAFVNAAVIARVLSTLLTATKLDVTVIACGERVPLGNNQFGEMRMAIEDYLAAGCILSSLTEPTSPEASVAESAYVANSSNIDQLIWESVSGREARDSGFGDDVRFAVRLNAIPAVPIFRDGSFMKY